MPGANRPTPHTLRPGACACVPARCCHLGCPAMAGLRLAAPPLMTRSFSEAPPACCTRALGDLRSFLMCCHLGCPAWLLRPRCRATLADCSVLTWCRALRPGFFIGMPGTNCPTPPTLLPGVCACVPA